MLLVVRSLNRCVGSLQKEVLSASVHHLVRWGHSDTPEYGTTHSDEPLAAFQWWCLETERTFHWFKYLPVVVTTSIFLCKLVALAEKLLLVALVGCPTSFHVSSSISGPSYSPYSMAERPCGLGIQNQLVFVEWASAILDCRKSALREREISNFRRLELGQSHGQVTVTALKLIEESNAERVVWKGELFVDYLHLQHYPTRGRINTF